MDSYSQLLEKIRIPQPSLQKFAVISIFENLRSAPPHLNPDSVHGTDAITQCLHSNSAAVLDQSVRELCRLVRDDKLDLSRGLLELQSALEGSDSRFVSLFVKGVGFLVRLGFEKNSLRFLSSETHPFVKVVSCRVEVQTELVQQVLVFIMQSKHLGMVEVCEFLLPFLNYSIVRMPSSVSVSSFMRSLISSLAGLCCSIPREAIPVIKLLIGRLKFFPCNKAEDFANTFHCVECIVDAYVVVLQRLVEIGLAYDAQVCGVELLDAMFSLCTNPKHTSSLENILEVSRRILIVQKDLGLSYMPELSTIMLSLFMILVQSELEHEQVLAVKLLLFLLKWKNEYEHNLHRDAYDLNEELLFIFPAISLLSSPSKSVKQAATDLLHILGKLANKLVIAQKTGQCPKGVKFPSISTPKYLVFRLLQHLWLQDLSPLSGSCFLNYAPGHDTSIRDKHYISKTWSSLVTDHLHRIIARRKSPSISPSQEIFSTNMPMILSAVACVLLMHKTDGSSSVDILANSSNVDPKIGVPLLLVIQFYNHICSTNTGVDCHGVLVSSVCCVKIYLPYLLLPPFQFM